MISGSSERPSRLPRPSILVLIYGATLAAVGVFLLAHVFGGATLNEISRDPMATMGGPPLTGAQSTLGVLIWWSAVGISLFAWAVLRRLGAERLLVSFLLWSGIITAMLALDDQFQFHDNLGSHIFGLRERYISGAYAVVIGLYVLRFWKVIRRSEWVLLVLAILFGIGSLAGDFASQRSLVEEGLKAPGGNLNYLEDVFKLFAIVSWSTYLIRFSLGRVTERFNHQDEVRAFE